MTIDVRGRRAERLLGVLALLGLAGAGALLPLATWQVGAVFILVTVAAVAGLWLQGWLGGARRLARIDWLPDGRWRLRDARHTDVTAELRPDSRIGAHWLWLRWQAGARRPSIFLIHGDLPDSDLRRLTVRLRLDARLHSRPAAESPVRDDAF